MFGLIPILKRDYPAGFPYSVLVAQSQVPLECSILMFGPIFLNSIGVDRSTDPKTLIVHDRKATMAKSRENSQNGAWLADPSSLQPSQEARPYIKTHENTE